MKMHEAIWTPPRPFWPGSPVAVAHPAAIPRAPAILRFATDNFMEDFLNTLATDPARLSQYKLRAETWRGFAPSPVAEPPQPTSADPRHPVRMALRMRQKTAVLPATQPAQTSGAPLKLYQPAHLRHYLVTSSLVCDILGLPDRQFAGSEERATFVIRRLLPPPGDTASEVSTWPEYSWVRTVNGFAWRKIDDDARFVSPDDEDRLPLFATPFTDPTETRRRLFSGVIPVGKRETYLGAPSTTATARDSLPGVTSKTARKILFRKEVVEPWKMLLTRADGVRQRWTKSTPDQRDANDADIGAQLKIEREQVQVISWLVLLDFAKFLSTYLKPVWRATLNPALGADLQGYERSVFNLLEGTIVGDDLYNVLHLGGVRGLGPKFYEQDTILRTLRAALAKFGSGTEGFNLTLENQLEALTAPYDRASATSRGLWPGFLFPLADPEFPTAAPLPTIPSQQPFTPEEADLTMDEKGPSEINSALDLRLKQLDQLAVVIVRALADEDPATPEPAIPTAAIPPANPLEGWFIIRFVYERPQCFPLHHEVVSDRTEPFQMAGFFDPDAPARPIRIGLPLDTTPAGLRKFDKNTAFVISNTLCGQIRRIRGLTLADLVLSVLPWPFHKDLSVPDGGPCQANGLSIGMICSLSIPIITLCALILLIIMVTLFDLIFSWMPFFVFCFPVPGLKAKKS